MSKPLQSSTDIARPPAAVFDHVSDATRLPAWQPSVDEAAFDCPQTGRWELEDTKPGALRWDDRQSNGKSPRASRDAAGAYAASMAPSAPTSASRSRRRGPARQVTSTTASKSRATEAASFSGCLPTKGARNDVPKTPARLKRRLEGSDEPT